MIAQMPFGRHKGRRLDQLPKDYLGWLLKSVDLNAGLEEAVLAELHRRRIAVYTAADVFRFLTDVEEDLTKRLATDPEIEHVDAGLITDHVMSAFQDAQQRLEANHLPTLALTRPTHPPCPTNQPTLFVF